jgi:hypothetical protein
MTKGGNMFKGATLELGDQQYVIPPLSLEKLEELEPRFHALSAPVGSFSERLQQLMPILLASFQRNYPEMTEADLRSQLDLPALNRLMQIIIAANGFTTEASTKQQAPSSKQDADSGLPTGNPSTALRACPELAEGAGSEPETENGSSMGESAPAKQ